ncbi:MAG TPA: amino acid adenylation domain-containing protein, partial [Candidatus Angelobacter sp.]|nr:amino acid adenylation domain-containing protein [Candidatus Angelobacter sp.]
MEHLGPLTERERQGVLYEWNEAKYPQEKFVHELFEEQVERTPEAVAVVYEEVSLNYAELNRRANQLAHYLRGMGVKPDNLVAICAERSLEMIVGLLGVLKAGAAYVPLDPAYPTQRLHYMLEDSGATVLLTQAKLRRLMSSSKVAVPPVYLNAEAWRQQPESNLDRGTVGLDPGNLAYVIYTSGSTGQPKGVMVEHCGVSNLVSEQIERFAIQADSRIVQFASFSFDASVWEIFMALCRGASLYLAPPREKLTSEILVEMVQQMGITHATFPPAFLSSLPEGVDLEPIGVLIVAGEALTETVARRWGRGRKLINAYGPTEASVCATMHEWRSEETGSPRIGRPIGNTRMYILDKQGEPVPIGVVGELYIGGAGVARGYLNRPELTAERFVADPYAGEAGVRMYKTGDLGRWLGDGNIEFIGRNDDQVKIRGFRVELGEIEAHLADHEGIRQAVVVGRQGVSGEIRLVAYYTVREDAPAAVGPIDAAGLRAYLAQRLPEYMIPAVFMSLSHWPMSPNGKLDRNALPVPEIAQPLLEATTEIEKALSRACSEVLGVGSVPLNSTFIELGGSSLNATRVIAAMRETSGSCPPLRDLLGPKMLFEIALELQQGRNQVSKAEIKLKARPKAARVIPAAYSQERIWFVQRMDPSNVAYHANAKIRFIGTFDKAALEKALTQIVARHEVYRTTLSEIDGSLFQVVHDPWIVELGEIDADNEGVTEKVFKELQSPFDLGSLPLVRWRLIRTGSNEHVLLMAEHHVIHDGWSFNVFVKELTEWYRSYTEGTCTEIHPNPFQFGDFSQWQREWVESEEAREQLKYWASVLADMPPTLLLPCDYPRPQVQTYQGGLVRSQLNNLVLDELQTAARRQHVTLFMLAAAALEILLYKYSSQGNFCIGTGIANRRWAETKDIIGMLINTIPLPAQINANISVAEVVRRVKQTTLDAYCNQDIPFEQVVQIVNPRRDPSYHPIFQVMLGFHDSPLECAPLMDTSLIIEQALGNGSAKLDLGVVMVPPQNHNLPSNYQPCWEILLEYNSDLFEQGRAQQITRHYISLFQAIAHDVSCNVSDISWLSKEELQQILYEWNATEREYPREKCVHELFEEQAERTPEATAVVFAEEELRYGELNGRANQLAHYLRGLGVRPEERVGICMERSLEMMVAVLGVLKAGGAYVPLDPAYPVERLKFMVEDSAPVAVLTQTQFKGLFAGFQQGLAMVDLAAETSIWEGMPKSNADGGRLGHSSGQLAYIIYTSGSTGRPKGVMVEHRGVINVIHGSLAKFGVERSSRVVQLASLTFDASVLEIFTAWLSGSVLYLIKREDLVSSADLGEFIGRNEITIMAIPPSLLE